MKSELMRQKARELLESGAVSVVIGYTEGSHGGVHAYFARNIHEADRLIYDERCTRNLAVYLHKEEVREMGKAAIVSHINGIRAVLQLMNEHQLPEGSVTVIGVEGDDAITVLKDAASLAGYISRIPVVVAPEDVELLKKLDAMTPPERWAFWMEKLSACVKCYACRAACPLCYCTRCTVECNQPQWIHVPSHELGNLEWHIMRAMHLAGRCINCGACYHACPLGIPIHLLTLKLAAEIGKNFNAHAGTGLEDGYVLATFKPDDNEHFIR